jgi:hypothetical protein
MLKKTQGPPACNLDSSLEIPVAGDIGRNADMIGAAVVGAAAGAGAARGTRRLRKATRRIVMRSGTVLTDMSDKMHWTQILE